MEKPIYKCMVKATTAEGEELRRSLNWVTSRRAILKIMPDSMVCGDWTIPYAEIEEAVLFSIWSMFMPAYILMVKSRGKIYQFGLNWNPYWKKELPFPARREKGRLKHSAYSIFVRLIALGYLIHLGWQYLMK